MQLRPFILALVVSCAANAAPGTAIPPEVEAALARAKIPREAVALLIVEADANNAAPRLIHRAQAPMNPASVMKLTTTFAALDLLGPAYAWTTPVFVDGPIQNGTLTGNVYIKGQGDPKLVLEKLWLLMRRLQGLGILQIAGDIVLDRNAFEVPDADPASFDGEPLRPYNAAPDALLLNFKAVVMTFTPDPARGTARVQFDPPLFGVQMQASVPLGNGDCGDYRAALKADFSDASRIRFGGSYAASCGEKVWPVAYANPRSYGARAVQGLGILQIAGDIVLDRNALDVPDADPASFDGEPLRPYNAAPDALLLNFKAVVMTFTPDPARGTTQVQFDPHLFGVQTQTAVPLGSGECGDYRAALKADFSDASRIRFGGSYAASCGEKVWPVAYADPRSYGARAVQGLWLEMGGKLTGSVRYGTVPAALVAAKPTFEVSSATLAEIIRDINKYSNNVMAQQVFLTLGRVVPPVALNANGEAPPTDTPLSAGSFSASRAVLQRWWKDRISADEMPVWDNGSGLSRQERISAQGLARLLQVAWRSPYMSELMSSLPITGVDGTLKRFKSKAVGSAHLKTGTLSNALARAGYVDGASGKRYVLVALINHANANTEAARAVMETLVDWTARDN